MRPFARCWLQRLITIRHRTSAPTSQTRRMLDTEASTSTDDHDPVADESSSSRLLISGSGVRVPGGAQRDDQRVHDSDHGRAGVVYGVVRRPCRLHVSSIAAHRHRAHPSRTSAADTFHSSTCDPGITEQPEDHQQHPFGGDSEWPPAGAGVLGGSFCSSRSRGSVIARSPVRTSRMWHGWRIEGAHGVPPPNTRQSRTCPLKGFAGPERGG